MAIGYDNVTRKVLNGTAIENSTNNGTKYYIANCITCGEDLSKHDEDEVIWFQPPSRSNGAYVCAKCLKSHKASEKYVGAKQSNGANFTVSFTVNADDIDTLAYGCSFPYFNYRNCGKMVKITSAKVINNSAMIKILNGFSAYGLNRTVTFTFYGKTVKCHMGNASDVIREAQKLLDCVEGSKPYKKHVETLTNLGAIIE